MSKVPIGNNVFLPMPMVIVGVRGKQKANFMPVGWASRANAAPPMIAVGINKVHLTSELIMEHKAFSVNVPTKDLIEKMDYCGLVSGKKEDKSALFKVFYGTKGGAPMIDECPLCIECKLVEAVPLPSNSIFVGEIVGAYAEKSCMSGDFVDMEKLGALTLTMPDNSYRGLGPVVGKAWSDGKKLMKK